MELIEIGKQEGLRKFLTAKDYFEYEKRKTQQSIKLANEWLLHQAYEGIDFSRLRFREHGKLLITLTTPTVKLNDDLPLEESSDFSVGENRYTESEKEMGEIFSEFTIRATKDAIAAIRWAIPKVLLLNGREITPQDFEETIKFEDAAILTRWLQGFL